MDLPNPGVKLGSPTLQVDSLPTELKDFKGNYFFNGFKNISINLSPFCCIPNFFIWRSLLLLKGFPDSSVGKESTCNVGDPSLIPGSGKSPGEGIGYPLQCSWASPMAQLVKNLPAIQETPV